MTRLQQLIDAIPDEPADWEWSSPGDLSDTLQERVTRRDAIIRAYHEALKQLHGASYYSNAPSEMEDADSLLARFNKEFGQ